MFAFLLGNRTLALDLLENVDYLDPADPGLGSTLEMSCAIFLNVLDVNTEGQVTNGSDAMRRAGQYLRSYCDPAYVVEPPFAGWETELS
jgi:hypothetical protein